MRRVQCATRRGCPCACGELDERVTNREGVPSVKSNPRRHACRTVIKRVIASWLCAHGQPLKAVAVRLGVAESTISQWATGRRFPRPKELDALAACAGVPAVCLFCPNLATAYERHVPQSI